MECLSNLSKHIPRIDCKDLLEGKDLHEDDYWITFTSLVYLGNIEKKALSPLLKSENCGMQTIGHILKITTLAITAIFMLAEALVRASLFVITSPLLLTDHSHIPKFFAVTATMNVLAAFLFCYREVGMSPQKAQGR